MRHPIFLEADAEKTLIGGGLTCCAKIKFTPRRPITYQKMSFLIVKGMKRVNEQNRLDGIRILQGNFFELL